MSVVVSTIAGAGGIGYLDGPGSSAKWRSPAGLALGPDGSLYLTDLLDARIRRIAPDLTVSTVAGDGTSGFADGPAAQARFFYPSGIVADGSGNLYVADQDNHRIRKIAAAGQVTTVAGDGERGYRDGSAAQARFWHPYGLDRDQDGNLFVAEYGGRRIRKITPAGDVSTLAGTGEAGKTNGPANAARFETPAGLAVAADGTIYVADQMSHTIRKLAGGVVSTLGSSGAPGFADGPGLQARFNGPYDVAVDAAGYVYVADFDGYRIRRISPDGTVVNLAGNGTEGYLDGFGGEAMFHHPIAVVVAPGGVLYVADIHSNRIRKIAPK